MKQQEMIESFLVLIPEEQLTFQQKQCRGHWRREASLPIYKMTREPKSLEDFEWESYRDIAIWLKDGLFILLCKPENHRYFSWKISFTIHVGKYQLSGAICSIYGEALDAVETFLDFYAPYQHCQASKVRFEIDWEHLEANDGDFDFAEHLDPEEIAFLLDASSKQQIKFAAGEWDAEQSVVLATRPYALDLKLAVSSPNWIYFTFQDGGTAFVEALEKRQSSFGSLCLEYDQEYIPLNSENFKRLCNLDTYFERLEISYVDGQDALLPLEAKTKALVYGFEANVYKATDLASLNIVAQDLDIDVCFDAQGDDEDSDNAWERRLISFLRRLAELGHFTRLNISFSIMQDVVPEQEEAITRVLIDTIKANPSLVHLDLTGWYSPFDLAPHLQQIFEAVEEHPGLRTLVVEQYPPNDPDYSWLRLLLSRNVYITVLDRSGNKCTDGSSIDRLYLLNKCYIDSRTLLRESVSLRPKLVATLLIQRALEKYKRNQVLLSQHMDVLCEFIQDMNLEYFYALEEHELPVSLHCNISENSPKRLRSSMEN
ncbi:hypothetical protein FisN_7Hu105 [Fistulifera solaris]|uniref:Uncharacterized protein n=1 Tax=Fistulifera solaris TaxID=1519565 RepID=A0A1Z5K3G9_FISSO|nr:hypothetical protein FisN_7Hu105 [Fistulifera solaris]|eukprot:GAX20793.1 hypothetical protein FisN_7Hu105 [Fistulifera solaris]